MFKLKYFLKNIRSKKRSKVLGPYAKGVIYETKNGTIALPIEDITIGKHLGFKGQWDITEVEKILDSCHPDDTVYIIGTHVGTLLLPLAKKVKQVIGYEANEDTYWYMQTNLKLNNINNVSLFNYAVGDLEKEVHFYKSKVNTGGSKIKPVKESVQYTYDNPDKVAVQMIVLDNHIKQENLPSPSSFIMDIEGAEYFALKGMQKSLSGVQFLYIEYVPHHLENVSDVSISEFMDLIIPHFNSAKFIKKNESFLLKNDEKTFLEYLNYLKTNNLAEDILFEK